MQQQIVMRQIILVLLLLLSLNSKGQKIEVPIFYDSNYICTVVDSLRKLNIGEIIVFQTERKFQYLKSEDNLLTFICWKRDKQFYVQIISNLKIYSCVSFHGERIFNFKRKLETLVSKDEQTLKFVPPVTTKNAIFYFMKDNSGYFELPDESTKSAMTYYSTNISKEKLRKIWYNEIYQTLLYEKFNFKILNNYDRYKGII